MIKVSGFDEFADRLNNLQKEVSKLENGIEIPFDELFTSSFMHKYTHSLSIDDFFTSGGFSAKSNTDFKSIADEDLDSHVRSNTSFNNWADMLNTAVKLYVSDKIKL